MTTPNDGGGATEAERACIECGQPITGAERFLRVTSHDGVQRYVHTLCFTSTTFDPDRYGEVADPET